MIDFIYKLNNLYYIINNFLYKMKKIKKIVAMTAITAISATTLAWAYAATKIGDATVTGNNTLNKDIMFDDASQTASWVVSGIKVTANILPTLNMNISADEIALGTLVPGVESSWTLNIEVGTNATTWVQITARSGSGWLTHKTDNSVQINNLTTDGNAESYTFTSTHTVDSTVTGFISNWDLKDNSGNPVEINDNTTENQIYLTNKPEITDGNNDVTFKVATTVNAQSIAGDYEDNITFTVVGNF